MGSSEYEKIDFDTVTEVRFSSQSGSTGASSSTDPDRQAAQNAHSDSFQEFTALYDTLREAIDREDRDLLFEALGTPNPYSESSNQPRFSSAFRDALPERFHTNHEEHEKPQYTFDGLFTGLSWGGNYKYSSAPMFALRVGWLMCIPMDEPEVRDYHDSRAGAHLRDLNAEYAPAKPGSRGNNLENAVERVVEESGLSLGPRKFDIETTDGMKNRILDVNTVLGGESVIMEVFTRSSSYYNKDDQVRDYAKLYERVEGSSGETPHVFHVTDTQESRVSEGVLDLLLSEQTEEVLRPPMEPRESDEEPFELTKGMDGYEELPEVVREHESQIEELLDECGLETSRPRLSMTVETKRSSRYTFGRTRSTTTTRHIQLGPTVEVGSSWQSITLTFLSAHRADEQILSYYRAGQRTSSGSIVYPVIVTEGESYVRGRTISTLGPNVLYGLLQAGIDEDSEGLDAFL